MKQTGIGEASSKGLDSEDGMQATHTSSVWKAITRREGTRIPGN